METTAQTPMPAPPLGLVEKSRVLLAAAAAAVLLTTVGWSIAQPDDPDLGVTIILNGGRALGIWPILILMTAVAAVIGTVLAPRRLAEGGLFAAAVGLTGLALRGGSMQDVLSYVGDTSLSGRRWLMARMALDAAMWTVVMAGAWLVVAIVRRWLWSDDEMYSALPLNRGPANPPQTASAPSQEAAAPAAGWPAMVMTGLVAVFFIWLTVARSPAANVARGQVIGSVAGGFYIGAMSARYFMGVHRSHWYLLSVPAAALLAYLIGYLNAGMGWATGEFKEFAALATTAPHALVRPLPIEYLAVGVTATLVGYWSGEKVEQVVEHGTKS